MKKTIAITTLGIIFGITTNAYATNGTATLYKQQLNHDTAKATNIIGQTLGTGLSGTPFSLGIYLHTTNPTSITQLTFGECTNSSCVSYSKYITNIATTTENTDGIYYFNIASSTFEMDKNKYYAFVLNPINFGTNSYIYGANYNAYPNGTTTYGGGDNNRPINDLYFELYTQTTPTTTRIINLVNPQNNSIVSLATTSEISWSYYWNQTDNPSYEIVAQLTNLDTGNISPDIALTIKNGSNSITSLQYKDFFPTINNGKYQLKLNFLDLTTGYEWGTKYFYWTQNTTIAPSEASQAGSEIGDYIGQYYERAINKIPFGYINQIYTVYKNVNSIATSTISNLSIPYTIGNKTGTILLIDWSKANTYTSQPAIAEQLNKSFKYISWGGAIMFLINMILKAITHLN